MSLVTTVLQDAIVRAQDRTFNDFEKRRSIYGALDAHMQDTDRLVPKTELENARASKGRPVKIPVLQKYQATLKNDYTCNFDPDQVTSAFSPITWATIGFDVAVEGAVNVDNYFSKVEELSWEIEMGLQRVAAALDAAAVAHLDTKKTAINTTPLYPFAAGVMSVPAAGKLDFYKNIGAIMRRNDLELPVMDIASTESMVDFTFIGQQGASNDVNTAYQISGIQPFRSNRVTNAAGVQETHYLVPRASIGMLSWIPFDYKVGSRVHEGEIWTTQVDPLMGLTFSVRYKRSCADPTETYARQTENVLREEWSFRMDYGFVSSYSSDTSSPIFKANILAPSGS
jgi:hypothetical protein